MSKADINAKASMILNALKTGDLYTHIGRIEQMVGMTIEADGLSCNIGDVCEISLSGDDSMVAEVVGFRGEKVLLMPYGDTSGIGYGATVKNLDKKMSIMVSNDLIGRTVDALGNPLDGGPEIKGGIEYSINGESANPLRRPRISKQIEMGVRAIDGLLTIGKGQRMGIFAGSGVGKSTLMGMLARNVRADVNVIALVGERGREVVEFINRDLGEEGAKRSVLVVATSDQPAMMRSKCALTATAIAEFFRDQGKDVLLMMDSLTRFAMAQREIGLSVGEPPVARGYPPSIYTALPKLLERSGNFEKGSITGIYTVLVEGDDANEPISDTVRGIIDGHIMLSRKIAMQNHYPAIDVLASVSRLMSDIATPNHKRLAGRFRNLLSVYRDNQDLIMIGAYKPGGNAELDFAVQHINQMNGFLQQQVDEKTDFTEIERLLAATME